MNKLLKSFFQRHGWNWAAFVFIGGGENSLFCNSVRFLMVSNKDDDDDDVAAADRDSTTS